eukprot:1811331-Pleurochrysis_carterae.AAC.2
MDLKVWRGRLLSALEVVVRHTICSEITIDESAASALITRATPGLDYPEPAADKPAKCIHATAAQMCNLWCCRSILLALRGYTSAGSVTAYCASMSKLLPSRKAGCTVPASSDPPEDAQSPVDRLHVPARGEEVTSSPSPQLASSPVQCRRRLLARCAAHALRLPSCAAPPPR